MSAQQGSAPLEVVHVPSKFRRGLRWLVSVSLIAALLWWADMPTLIQALVGARPTLLVLALALCVTHRILMSVRWKMILAPETSGEALLFGLVLRGLSHVLATLPGGILFALHSPRLSPGRRERLDTVAS